LSQGKGRRKNPRAKSSVPGHPGKKTHSQKTQKKLSILQIYALFRKKIVTVPYCSESHPFLWQDFELVPFASLSQDIEGTSVPLSPKVALSRLVEQVLWEQLSATTI
jgi:hypothetical protein